MLVAPQKCGYMELQVVPGSSNMRLQQCEIPPGIRGADATCSAIKLLSFTVLQVVLG